jgi:GxxExxY protein
MKGEEMGNILYPDESYRIIGACFEVYNDKGCGFLEPVYQECLEIEFDYQKIPYVAQPPKTLTYRGRKLRRKYQPDFICYDTIVVEIKAVKQLIDEHRAKVLNYLYVTKHQLGILVNFGHYPKLEYKRIALTRSRIQVPANYANGRE